MTVNTDTETDQTVDAQVDDQQTDDTATTGADALGDAGKKALDAMKAQRKAAQDAEKAARAELEALKAQIAGKEAEHAAEVEKQKAKDEALAAANRRILSAELRAAAKGKLADPSDAHLFISLDEFTVGDEGEVDTESLNAAIDDLLARKPHLGAAQSRFQGDGDGGAQGKSAKTPQMTQAEFDRIKSDPHAVMKAKTEGRLNKLLGIET